MEIHSKMYHPLLRILPIMNKRKREEMKVFQSIC